MANELSTLPVGDESRAGLDVADQGVVDAHGDLSGVLKQHTGEEIPGPSKRVLNNASPSLSIRSRSSSHAVSPLSSAFITSSTLSSWFSFPLRAEIPATLSKDKISEDCRVLTWPAVDLQARVMPLDFDVQRYHFLVSLISSMMPLDSDVQRFHQN